MARSLSHVLELHRSLNEETGSHHRNIKLSALRSGVGPESPLKVRMVTEVRKLKKVSSLLGTFMDSFPWCVRENPRVEGEELTYTVFDGNHRFHALTCLGGAEGRYTPDFQLPCMVYLESLPDEAAMEHSNLLNDM